MSTILEALKKSEQERKLNNVPTLSDMPTPQEPSRLPLILQTTIAILLLALMGILLGQWWGSKQASPASVQGDHQVSNRQQSVQPGSDERVVDDIVVNVISFSEQTEQRFVMINGKLLRENQFVRAGLKVESIQKDSVVLNLRGQRITRML